MGRKENLELRHQIWVAYINDKNQHSVAKKLGVSQQLVSYHINKVKRSNEYRDNVRSMQEFQDLRMETIDAITEDIRQLTEKMEEIDDPVVWKMYHDARHARRIDLYKVQGDGETVLALRRKMNEGISDRAPEITQGN